MTGATGLTQAAASLLEVEPALARSLGPRAAAELGHEPILPVLSVPPGPWEPPERHALGAVSLALVVLDGLLATGSPVCTIGPGDVIEPWSDPVVWTACTPVRFAVIGSPFMDAVRPWPHVAARLLARAQARSSVHAVAGPVDERALDLLWWIAGRWGVNEDDHILLPRELDHRVVALLLQVPERRAAAAMRLLALRGEVGRRDGGGWRLTAVTSGPRSGYSRERRDGLRSRAVQQIARAREMNAQCVSLSADVQGALATRRPRRRPG